MYNGPEFEIIKKEYHRNGISGLGFTVYILNDVEHGKMVAIIPEEDEYNNYDGVPCFVLNINNLVEENIEFANGNSWCGDRYYNEIKRLECEKSL